MAAAARVYRISDDELIAEAVWTPADLSRVVEGVETLVRWLVRRRPSDVTAGDDELQDRDALARAIRMRCLGGRGDLRSPIADPVALPYVLCWIAAGLDARESAPETSLFARYPSRSLREGLALVRRCFDEAAPPRRSRPETLATALGRLVEGLRRRGLRPMPARCTAATVGLVLVTADDGLDFARCRVRLDLVESFYRGSAPPSGLDVIHTHKLRSTHPLPVRRAERSTRARLLAALDRLPLGGDLHRHLTGTGGAKLWRSAYRTGESGERRFVMVDGESGWEPFDRVYAARHEVKAQPAFLRRLLEANIDEAVTERVCYLELSAGPFLFSDERLWSIAREAAQRAERRGVTIRYLVGLQRATAHYGLTGHFEFDAERGHHVLRVDQWLNAVRIGEFREAFEMGFVPPDEDRQERVMQSLVDRGVLRDPLVVGVDYVGLERGQPIHGQIPTFTIFSEGGGRELGARVHAGEGVEDAAELFTALQWVDVLRPMVRIGHGVGFAAHIHHREFPSSRPTATLLERLVGTQDVAIEVNLSSNEALLDVAVGEHPLSLFLDQGFSVVLSTDNPGVIGTTLRREYQRAIETGHIRSRHELNGLILNSIERSFLDAARKVELLDGLTAELQSSLVRRRRSVGRGGMGSRAETD